MVFFFVYYTWYASNFIFSYRYVTVPVLFIKDYPFSTHFFCTSTFSPYKMLWPGIPSAWRSASTLHLGWGHSAESL